MPTGLVGGTYQLGMNPCAMDLVEIHGVYVGSSKDMEEVANYVANKTVGCLSTVHVIWPIQTKYNLSNEPHVPHSTK